MGGFAREIQERAREGAQSTSVTKSGGRWYAFEQRSNRGKQGKGIT